jgi:hypothetical protein
MGHQTTTRSADLSRQMCQLERRVTAPMADSMPMLYLQRECLLVFDISQFYRPRNGGSNFFFRVCIFQAEGAQLLQELPLPNIVEISFSPRGTYLSTWERPGMSSTYSNSHLLFIYLQLNSKTVSSTRTSECFQYRQGRS